jgi:hypothetical protein
MGDQAEPDQGGQDEAEGGTRKRERTLIEFPYTDIARAEDLAEKLAVAGGKVWIEQTQLAVAMDMSAGGGTFRGRLSAARMFGFIETEGGKVRLSDLGLLLLDDTTKRSALVEAFLRVPLYSAMYDSYNGFALPPAAAIERQMHSLGVPPKQTERARQAFASSAQHAGYIASNGRFSKPLIAPAPVREDDGGEGSGGHGGGSGGSGGNGGGGGGGGDRSGREEKKLEYRLVDLMEDAMDDPEALQAILKVITFVKTRDAAKENGD